MNNTFNLNRFGLLVKRQWFDFGKIYLGALMIMAIVIFSFYCYFAPSPDSGEFLDYEGNLDMRFRYDVAITLGFLFISITSSTYFNNLGQKSRAIHELLIPASTFEKFAVSIFYTVMVSTIGYMVIFYLIDFGFVKYLNANLTTFQRASSGKNDLREVDTVLHQVLSDKNYIRYSSSFFVIPFMVTSIFLLGSIYFKRFHYIKTAISIIVFGYIAGYLIYKISMLLTRNMARSQGHFQEHEALILVFVVSTFLTLMLWLITYIRLQEKEV